jgi:acyl-CoA thioesterase
MTAAFLQGVALEALGDGRYRGEADKRWEIYKGPNGGYVAAIVLNAHVQELDDPARRPRSFAVNFVSRTFAGPVDLEVTVDRIGRSYSSTSARLFQEGKLCGVSHCAFGVSVEGDSYDEVGIPEVPKPEGLPEAPIPPEMLPPFAAQFDYRMALGNLPYSRADNAVVGGWIRPKDPVPVDAVYLAAVADAFPPALFARLDRPVDVPTIDLTVHFLGRLPLDPDWVLCRFESPVGHDGVLIEDGWMWSREGNLLARSRQLALFRT